MASKEEEEKARIEKEWRAAQFFIGKGPSATLEYLVDEARAQLFAYQAQALDGPCPPGQDGTLNVDPALRRKQEAWQSLGGMTRGEAKKMYVQLLTTVLPEWKKWDEKHGEALRVEQQQGGEAQRLLRAFRERTGVHHFPSRL